MTETLTREFAPATGLPGDSAAPATVANPGLLGLPLTIAGAVGLGFTNTGIVSAAAAPVPILLSATAVGLLLTTIWSAALGQNVNATVYGVFLGFYGSFAALSLGQTHNWFGIPPEAATQTTVLWLGSWLLVIGLLTVLTLRLPWTYPVLFAVVDIALVLLIVGAASGDVAATRAGGWAIFVFVGFAVYFYVAALWEETGGRALPLGRPLIS